MSKIRMNTEFRNKILNRYVDNAKMINNVSRSGQLYGQLFAIKDMQIHLLEQEKKIKDEIEREENNE